MVNDGKPARPLGVELQGADRWSGAGRSTWGGVIFYDAPTGLPSGRMANQVPPTP